MCVCVSLSLLPSRSLAIFLDCLPDAPSPCHHLSLSLALLLYFQRRRDVAALVEGATAQLSAAEAAAAAARSVASESDLLRASAEERCAALGVALEGARGAVQAVQVRRHRLVMQGGQTRVLSPPTAFSSSDR